MSASASSLKRLGRPCAPSSPPARCGSLPTWSRRTPAVACFATYTRQTAWWLLNWPARAWARALPVAPNLAEREAIDRAVAAARAANVGIWALNSASVALSVDKIQEIVTLTNTGPGPLDVSGWWLVSLRGKQGFRFPPGTTIGPGETLRVVSGQASGAHRFQQRNVWNNSDPDPAELRRLDGRIVAVWDDPESRESQR